MSLLARDLVVVTGKGGVGKSTVAAALGVAAARRGLRAVVAEVAGRGDARRLLGDSGVEHVSITPQAAMEEYLRDQLPRPAAELLAHSGTFRAFVEATPGMSELLSIGKVWELAQLERQSQAAPYDLVVVDAPATGHGVGILRTPQTFADIARVGPIARQGTTIARTIADREFTAILAVATAEEMPVNETVLLSQMLEREGLTLDAVILNALYPTRFDQAETDRLAGVLTRTRSRLTRSALSAALSEHARAECQNAQRDRLAHGLSAPLVELPYLFCEQLGVPELHRLADILDESL